MKTKNIAIIALVIVGAAGVLISMPAAATDMYPVDFKCPSAPCTFADMYILVYNNTQLQDLLPDDMKSLLIILWPASSDLNGPSWVDSSVSPTDIHLIGNGMNDAYAELELVKYFLSHTSFSVNGLTGQMVRNNYNFDRLQIGIDIGSYWLLLPSIANGLHQILLGHILVGDGDAVFSKEKTPGQGDYQRADYTGSWGFVRALFFLLGTAGIGANGNLDVNLYHRMPEYFSKDGDCDGDGATNGCEYETYAVPPFPASYTTYITNARTPTIYPPGCVQFMFSQQPVGGTIYVGDSHNFTVAVKNNNGAVTYQWNKDGTDIDGATAATYSLLDAPLGNSLYQCTATDQTPDVIVSNAVRLTVELRVFKFTTQPLGGNVVKGGNRDLTVVVANNNGAVTYQWKKDGSIIDGANAATLHLVNATKDKDEGLYQCIATDQTPATIESTVVQIIVVEYSVPTTSYAGFAALAACLIALGSLVVFVRKARST